MTRPESYQRFEIETVNEVDPQSTSSVFGKVSLHKKNSEDQKGLAAYPLSREKQLVKEFDKVSSKDGSSGKKHNSSAEWMINARLLLDAGEISLAVKLLSKILAVDSHNELAMDLMARCLVEQGKSSEALRVRSELARIYPSFVNFARLATAHYELGHSEAAESIYFQARSCCQGQHQELFDVEKNLGNLMLRKGDLEGAEEHYNLAFAIHPESDALLVNYGTMEIQKSNFSGAVDRFRQAVEINAENDRAWLGLSLVHREFGDFDLCWGNIEKALDINPKNETAIHLMMDWGFKDNKMARTIGRLEEYVHLCPEDIEVNLVLAKVLFCTDQYVRAQVEVGKVLASSPDYEPALQMETMIKEKLIQVDGVKCD